jgi:LPXTG-site transpeptidase (sortase) family protein
MFKHPLKTRVIGRLLAAALAGSLLLVSFASIAQETGQAIEEKPVYLEPSTQFYVWIQDPWTGETELSLVEEPNKDLWNATRIDDYREALAVDASPPLGVLSIATLDIQVPVYNGTDEFNLNRGLGRIRGMARLGEDGNLGISGHRDGFFRGLKDIQSGDEIELKTAGGVQRYSVTEITIVDKHDESPLEPTEENQLTLVTCYPFYFVGHAPKRYIVTAIPLATPVVEQGGIEL